MGARNKIDTNILIAIFDFASLTSGFAAACSVSCSVRNVWRATWRHQRRYAARSRNGLVAVLSMSIAPLKWILSTGNSQ